MSHPITSESITAGHLDKVADQISDAIHGGGAFSGRAPVKVDRSAYSRYIARAPSTPELETLIRGFIASLVELVERDVAHRAQHAVVSAFVRRGAARKRKVPLATDKPPSVASPVGRARTVTPRLARARKIQGKYMAAVRGLKPEDQKRVKNLTSEKGAAAGLILARSLGQGLKQVPQRAT